MWRMCRKTIFPRWHANRQNPVENKNKKAECSKSLAVLPSVDDTRYSNGQSEQKQHAHKQKERFWDDPQFQYYSIRKSLLETAGWLGTAVALCLNIHHRHYKSFYRYDGPRSSCIFSRLAFAMPHGGSKCEALPFKTETIGQISEHLETSSPESQPKKDNASDTVDSIMQSFKKTALQYIALIENATGCQNLNLDEKVSFESFQASAQLGSAQGFYNLGLCYELGKGTHKDMTKAAYCYRQAAMKGHGLASYNLAIYFLNGLGGLPVDSETAGQLMLEAADQGVPEAQLYLGVEYLEEEMYTDAFRIFSELASRNNTEGKYHLGLCYENGWGVKQDEMAALEMFSQAATQGHTEATLSLGKYVEEGRGGYDTDKEFAFTLYQMLADSGIKEGRDAASLLKNKIESNSSLATTKLSSQTQRNSMHVSTSVPELNSDKKSSNTKDFRLTTPAYLDLILPFIPFPSSESCKIGKTKFYLGEELSSTHQNHINILPYHQNHGPQLMTAKT